MSSGGNLSEGCVFGHMASNQLCPSEPLRDSLKTWFLVIPCGGCHKVFPKWLTVNVKEEECWGSDAGEFTEDRCELEELVVVPLQRQLSVLPVLIVWFSRLVQRH